jgi:hypothetical protein
LEEYYKGIETDDLDLDFAAEEEKNEIEERKAGRIWRALRASDRRFVLCEKIQYGTNLKALVEEESQRIDKEDEKGDGEHEEEKGNAEVMPDTELNGEENGIESEAEPKAEVEAANVPENATGPGIVPQSQDADADITGTEKSEEQQAEVGEATVESDNHDSGEVET